MNWNIYKSEREKVINPLCENLIKWNIGPHPAYRFEMRNLTKNHWKILCEMRSGHSQLNGQRKFGMVTKNCENNNCDNISIETTMHFIMDCDQYNEHRDILFSNIQDVYNQYRNIENTEDEIEEKKDNLKFIEIDKDDQLFFILFPFQNQLLNTEIREKKKIYNTLMGERLFVLQKLMFYIKQTDRFDIIYYN